MIPLNIDFHAHILPGADHGSSSREVSLGQLKLLRDAGIDIVVATPHFYPHRTNLQQYSERRDHSATALSALLGQDAPTVYLGAEVHMCPDLEEMEGLNTLAIQGTNTILLEMPMGEWSCRLFDTLYAIKEERGLHPVIAHLDRYSPKQVKEMLHHPFDVQLNAEAFAGCFHGKANRILKSGHVVALGSDLHKEDANALALYARAKGKIGAGFAPLMEKSQNLLKGAIPLTQLGKVIV